MDKKKIFSSLALAGIMTASVLGTNVNATTEKQDYLRPVGVYQKLVEGELVVPYVLHKNTSLTAKDIKCEFANVETIGGKPVAEIEDSFILKTGDTFKVKNNTRQYTIIIYGDVNGDGRITTLDASMIQKIALKDTNTIAKVSKFALEAADVVNDINLHNVTTMDAARVQKYVLGIGQMDSVINQLPPVEDVTPPVIHGVTNGDKLYINLNDAQYETQMPTVTATDDYDGEVEVVMTGEVKIAEEGEYAIIYTATDTAGNEATATLTVVVDNQAPELKGITDGEKFYLKINDSDFTLPEVTAEDTVDGEIAVTQTGTFDVTTEGEYEIVYEATDTIENKTTATITVVVDGTAPKADVNYSTTVLTKENVMVTIISDEPIQAPEGWELAEDGLSIKKPYTGNVNEKLMVSDLAGNETEVQIIITNIDKEVTATPSYSTTNPTKGTVIATITSDEVLQEVDGWTLSSDKMSMTKEYAQNVIEDVMVKDMLGNETTVTINIQNIDHVAPKAEVQYDVTELTNGNVQVTMIANEKLQAVTGTSNWQLNTEDPTKATATFTANATENVTLTDLAGNDAIIPVTISNIDKNAPVLTTEYNITSLTNQNVMATIKADEKLQELDGWELAKDGLSMSKEYDANISEDIKVKDLAGNEAIATITIVNIDKEAPVVEGLTEGKTSYQTVTLKFTEGVATLQKDNEAPQKYVSETPITVDGKYVLIVTDPAGNTTTKEFTIDNIAPVFETLEPVILKKGDTFDTTVVANDAVDGNITATLKITLNTNEVTQIDTTGAQDGEYILTYTATDEAGNTATTTRTVTVDATPAKRVGQVKYSETSATTEVIARVTFDEKVEAPKTDSEWVPVDENQLAFTKKYTANVNETVIFTDMAGNETKVNIVINNIDSDVPSYSIDYDIEEPTKGPVTVTIAAGEELQPVNGWTLAPDQLSMEKIYTENKTETVIIKDLAGNEATVLVEVNNIDKVAPTPSVSYSETNPTTQNVIVTIQAIEELQAIDGWKLAQDKCSMEKPYTENTTAPETIIVKDLAGNEATVTVNVNNIDREAPTVTGVEDGKSYQTVTPIFTDPNGPITATLQKGTEEPINFVSGTEVKEEGTYKLVVKDGLNNTITILFTIDTTVTIHNVEDGERYTSVAPTFTEGTGELSKLDPENGDAVISTILYQSGTPITESGKYKLVVTDAAGNMVTVIFTVDVTGPVITGVENNKTYATNITPSVTTTGTIKSVVLKKNNEIVEGYTTSLGEITEEGTYELKVTDDLGNTTTVKFTIDKTAPEVSGVEMNGEYKTATPVFTEGTTATLQKGSEEAADFISGTIIAADGEYTLVVTDEVGNARTILFKIDNVPPEITGIMDGEIYTSAVTPVNVAGDVEKVSLVKDGVEDKTYTTLAQITADGEYQLTVADKAGNTTTIEFIIDTQVKGLRFTTENNNKPTKDSVMVTIKAEEKLRPVTGWALSKDGLSMTKVYEDNKTETVTVFDLVGNSETLTIVVEGIDKVAPTAIAEPYYSEKTPTKDPVTVIIEASEPIQEVNGWKLSDDKQTLTKIFVNNEKEEVKLIDLAGNEIETPIKITVDNIYLTAPVITGMSEKEEITLPKATGKVELPKVTATDAKGQTIAVTTSIKQIISEVNIKEVSEINLAIPGDYTVTYTAQDVAGNTTEVTRIIHIVES